MRIICLEKSYIKMLWRNYPRTHSKKQKLDISLDQQSKLFLQIIFIVCQDLDYRNILKLNGRPLPFASYKAFLKMKKRVRTSRSDSFPAWLLKKKYFPRHILVTDQSSCLYFVRYCEICVS